MQSFNRALLAYLEQWKNKSNRKPLIIRGARQVGKTSLALLFGEKNFRNTVYINLEDVKQKAYFENPVSVEDFELILSSNYNQKMVAGETLLVIDEIQNSQHLVSLLRFFYEQRPSWYVVCAGSLLDAKINKKEISIPVGRVEFAYLYPLNYFEFLEACGKVDLLGSLKKFDPQNGLSETAHSLATNLFRDYCMMGGMPAVVKEYMENGLASPEIPNLYSSIFNTYLDDLYKYSQSTELDKLVFILQNAPKQVGSLYSYQGFAGSDYASRETRSALDTLERVLLLYQVMPTSSNELPLVEKPQRPKKLVFLDVGFVNHVADLFPQFISAKDLSGLYNGAIAEQVVGQNLLSLNQFSPPSGLYYWSREKGVGNAEVDFCFAYQNKIVGVEVKSSASGKLRSLHSFAQRVNNAACIRVYGGVFRREKVLGDSEFTSVPFYLLPRITDFI